MTPLPVDRLFVLVLGATSALTAQSLPSRRITMPAPSEYAEAIKLTPVSPRPAEFGLARMRQSASKLQEAAAPFRISVPSISRACKGDIEAIFAWVRDSIGHDPYPGVLRGADGAMHARRANDCDRALLLAALLQDSGYETRFAIGVLDADRERALYERTFAPTPGPEGSTLLTSLLRDHFFTELATLTNRDAATLLSALGDAVPVAGNPSAAQQHVWVQARTERGWVDLDATFADAKPGTALCKATTTKPVLGPELFQRITIRVIAETLVGGKLTRKTALEFTRPVADLADRELFVLHLPGMAGGSAGALFAAADKGAWSPAVYANGVVHAGTPIAYDPPKTVKGFGELGGALAGGGNAEHAEFVAEWLEIDVAIPGRETSTTVRALVDRAPDALRRLGKIEKATLRPLVRDRDGKPCAPADLHNLQVSSGAHDVAAWAHSIGTFVGRLEESPTRPDPVPPANPGPGAGDGPPFEEVATLTANNNRVWALLSDAVATTALGDRPGLRAFVDSPRIWIMTLGSAGTAESCFLRTDVFRHDMGFAAKSAEDLAAVPRRRIWLGFLEGSLEQMLISFGTENGTQEPCQSASRWNEPGAMSLVRPGSEAASSLTAANANLEARLRNSLERGSTLLVSRKLLASNAPLESTGWWEVDVHGNARAVLGADYGGASCELAPAGREPKMPVNRPPPVKYAHNAHKVGGGDEYTLLQKIWYWVTSNAGPLLVAANLMIWGRVVSYFF